MEVLCKHCNASFVTKRKGQIYCSKVCFGRYKAGLLCPKHYIEKDKWGHCPQCKRESDKRYSSSNRGKLSRRLKSQRWMSTPKGKLQNGAKQAVRYGIRVGKLIRLPCQVCGDPKSEAHHYLGYSKEHRLDVIFLCRAHHVIADEELKPRALSSRG